MDACTLDPATTICNLADEETVLPAVGFPNYFVSDHGNVFRSVLVHGQPTLRPVHGTLARVGYRVVHLRGADGRTMPRYVHRLVAFAFLPEHQPGQEVRHLDGDRLNNNASNLAWGTRHDNVQDMIRHGRQLKGMKLPASILTDTDVLVVRYLLSRGSTPTSVATALSVGLGAILDIKNGVTWREVKGCDPFSLSRGT